ncbi:MAG: hypothetical protein ACK4PR_09570, partial [Gammaproteobacteria bacterium]
TIVVATLPALRTNLREAYSVSHLPIMLSVNAQCRFRALMRATISTSYYYFVLVNAHCPLSVVMMTIYYYLSHF